MSSETLPDTNAAKPPVETAPSLQAPEEPKWSQSFGVVGMFVFVFGIAVVGANMIIGPRLLDRNWGVLCIAVGILQMLFHAFREQDYHIRRAYGIFGYSLLGAIIVVTIPNRANFLIYGWAFALGGLAFLLCFCRNEVEKSWRRPALWTIGIAGAAMALLGLFNDSILAPYGVVLAVLGLIFLCAFVGQSDSLTSIGFRTGLAMGAAAAFVILYAIFLSVRSDMLGSKAERFLVPKGLILIFLGVLYGFTSLGIVSDNKLVVQTRRELTAFFYSPVAYIVMLAMALIAALEYWQFVRHLLRDSLPEPVIFQYLGRLPHIVVIFLVPAITMRLVAEEKRSGTYEVLMSAPVKESTVVLGKFFACMIFYLLLWSIWGINLIALRIDGGEFEYRPLLSFLLAVTVSGAGFIGMGLFFSSLCKNQIIAAVLTFMGMLALATTLILRGIESITPIWRVVFQHLSYPLLWFNAQLGQLQVREMILQGSFAVFWLFLTVKVLEARRWS